MRDDQGESLSSSASPTLTATLATTSCLRLHLSSVAGEWRIWQCSSSFVFPFPSIPYSDTPSAPLGASLSPCLAPQVSHGQPQGEKTITKLSGFPRSHSFLWRLAVSALELMLPSALPFGYLPEGPAVRHPLSLFLRPSLAEGRLSATPASLLPASFPSHFPSPSIELPPLGTPSRLPCLPWLRVEEGHAATPLSLAPLLPEVSTTRTSCRCGLPPSSGASSSSSSVSSPPLTSPLLLYRLFSSSPPPTSPPLLRCPFSSPLSPPLLRCLRLFLTSPSLPRRLRLFLTSLSLPRRLLLFRAVSLFGDRLPPSCLVSLPSSAPPSFPSAVTPGGKAVAIPSPRLFCYLPGGPPRPRRPCRNDEAEVWTRKKGSFTKTLVKRSQLAGWPVVNLAGGGVVA